MVTLPTHQQFHVLGTVLERPPELLIIGGLGDGTEAEICREKWAGCRIIGIDPDRRAIDFQKTRGWREVDPLICHPLGEVVETARMRVCDLSANTLHREMVDAETDPNNIIPVTTTTLDQLEITHGPFPNNTVVWLDTEGYDAKAVRGGKQLFASGKVSCLITEVWTSRPDTADDNFWLWHHMLDLGYKLTEVFGVEWWGYNQVWLKR